MILGPSGLERLKERNRTATKVLYQQITSGINDRLLPTSYHTVITDSGLNMSYY